MTIALSQCKLIPRQPRLLGPCSLRCFDLLVRRTGGRRSRIFLLHAFCLLELLEVAPLRFGELFLQLLAFQVLLLELLQVGPLRVAQLFLQLLAFHVLLRLLFLLLREHKVQVLYFLFIVSPGPLQLFLVACLGFLQLLEVLFGLLVLFQKPLVGRLVALNLLVIVGPLLLQVLLL